MKLTTESFHLFRDYIKERSGIYFRDEKQYYVESRIESRCATLGCDSAEDYFRLIKYDSDGMELINFIESLTTNETFFFRDIKQLTMFRDEALAQVLENKRKAGQRSLKIWSAGCSTGEEPYTVAMLASEVAPDMDIKIYAWDINSRVIEHAKQGIYRGRSLKDVPAEYIKKYFNENGEEYEVREAVKNKVEFKIMNLMDKVQMKAMLGMDFIFCRNVLIYFHQNDAHQIVSWFYNSLNKGGYVFLGLAESMHMLSGAFKLVKFKELFGYMKE